MHIAFKKGAETATAATFYFKQSVILNCHSILSAADDCDLSRECE